MTEQLIATGKVSRGAIGVAVQDMTPLLARAMGLSASVGALVSEVIAGSPASSSGLRVGDVITALNRKAVVSGVDLRNIVGQMRPRTKIRLSYLRESKEREISLIVQTGRTAEVVPQPHSETPGRLYSP